MVEQVSTTFRTAFAPGRSVFLAVALAALVGAFGTAGVARGQSDASGQGAARSAEAKSPLVIDDFEGYEVDTVPETWKFVDRSGEEIPAPQALEANELFHVRQNDGNQFLRVKTVNESIRFSQTQEGSLDWNVKEYPHLQWRWRARHLPEGASEKDENDAGGALYVTFDTDWLGRPKSIKYTYSSSLPVDTVVDFGKLYVIVVDSKPASGTGTWKTVRRDLLEDYDRIFGGSPPDRPLSITIWSDSDSTSDWAEVDFDDIELLPARER